MEKNDILEIMKSFDGSSLAELSLEKGDFKVNMRKSVAFAHEARARSPTSESDARPSSAEKEANGIPEAACDAGMEKILSPLVATFYRSPAPDAPPFAEIGKRVKKGEALCVLEAMKVMNSFESEFDCEVVSVLAENGKLVEYGQALFEVKRV